MESKPDPKLLFYRVSGHKTGGHFSWKHSKTLLFFTLESVLQWCQMR